jgi:hypothetical protein
MTESIRDNKVEEVAGQSPEHPVYVYESAGISERKGYVPVWLWLVAASLLIWGGYYLVTYWDAP